MKELVMKTENPIITDMPEWQAQQQAARQMTLL